MVYENTNKRDFKQLVIFKFYKADQNLKNQILEIWTINCRFMKVVVLCINSFNVYYNSSWHLYVKN